MSLPGTRRVRVPLRVLGCLVFIGMTEGNNYTGHRLVGSNTEQGGIPREGHGRSAPLVLGLQGCSRIVCSGKEQNWDRE